jgi:hypothetical protein
VTAGRQQDMAKGAFHTTRSRWKEKEGVVGEGARAREEAMGRGLEGRGRRKAVSQASVGGGEWCVGE